MHCIVYISALCAPMGQAETGRGLGGKINGRRSLWGAQVFPLLSTL